MVYCKVTTTLITKHTVWRTSISFTVSIHSTERTLNIRLRPTVQLRRCCKYDSVSTDRNLRDVHSYIASGIWCFVFQLFRTRQITENSAFVLISHSLVLSGFFYTITTFVKVRCRMWVMQIEMWCRQHLYTNKKRGFRPYDSSTVISISNKHNRSSSINVIISKNRSISILITIFIIIVVSSNISGYNNNNNNNTNTNKVAST